MVRGYRGEYCVFRDLNVDGFCTPDTPEFFPRLDSKNVFFVYTGVYVIDLMEFKDISSHKGG